MAQHQWSPIAVMQAIVEHVSASHRSAVDSCCFCAFVPVLWLRRMPLLLAASDVCVLLLVPAG
jgi:hypothetical protein